jgi:hypothetical protein
VFLTASVRVSSRSQRAARDGLGEAGSRDRERRVRRR